MPAHMGLRFKVTLLSGLGNVHQEVDLKGYQIYKIPQVAWSTSSFWGGGGGGRSTVSTGLENLEEINEIIPLKNS